MAKSALRFQHPQDEQGPPSGGDSVVHALGGHAVIHSFNEFCLVELEGHGLCVIDVFDKTFTPIEKLNRERKG